MTPTRTQISRRTLLGAAAALPLLAACGNRGGSGGTGTVRFEGWDYEPPLVEENIGNFSKLHPEIKVQYTPITSAQYRQKVVAEFTGKNGPDALYVYDDSLGTWVQSGYLQPIDGLPGVDEVYNGIYDANAKAMTFQGKRYGLPYYTDCMGLIYNAEILEKAGISAPPKSLDELEQQSLKIKNAGLVPYPLAFAAQLQDTWQSWIWALVYSSGGLLFSDDMKPVMNGADPVAGQAFEWLHRAANQSRIVDPASLQLTPVPLDNAMKAGQYAFNFGARYALRDYNDPARSQQAGKLKLAPIPSLDGTLKGTVGTTRMYCLAADTDVKDQAMTLLNYLGGYTDGQPATARYWFLKRGLGFTFKDLAQDKEITEALAKFVDPAIYAQLAEVAEARNVVHAPWYAEFEASLQKTTQQVLTDQTTAPAAMTALADSANALAKKYS
ncbi:sugar ABC transporter substrate-binding protein [Actinomycetes bacterium KLBMP 9759]